MITSPTDQMNVDEAQRLETQDANLLRSHNKASAKARVANEANNAAMRDAEAQRLADQPYPLTTDPNQIDVTNHNTRPFPVARNYNGEIINKETHVGVDGKTYMYTTKGEEVMVDANGNLLNEYAQYDSDGNLLNAQFSDIGIGTDQSGTPLPDARYSNVELIRKTKARVAAKAYNEAHASVSVLPLTTVNPIPAPAPYVGIDGKVYASVDQRPYIGSDGRAYVDINGRTFVDEEPPQMRVAREKAAQKQANRIYSPFGNI